MSARTDDVMDSDKNRDQILKEAFGYHKALVAYAYGLLRDYALAEDAVQSGYVALTKRFDTISGDSVLAWCRGAVRLEALQLIRKRDKAPSLEETVLFDAVADAFEIEQTPDREAIRLERLEKLRDCFAKVPERSQKMVSGRYLDGLGLQELAQRLNMSEAAVRKGIYRTRLLLRECMERKPITPTST